MTQDEFFEKLSKQFPKVAKAPVQVKDYLTVRLNAPDELLPVVRWMKAEGFDYLETVTGVDWLGPVNMGGYIREPNPNPFLPEGATPQVSSAATPGVNYRPIFDLVWVLTNLKERVRVFLKLEVPREGAKVPSLTGLFKAADWQERETFDMLGVRYEGHPNLTKILTPDFIHGHPLRKDYVHVKDKYDQ
jgi:NADH:ubiquinone oxidoreductase subunit C